MRTAASVVRRRLARKRRYVAAGCRLRRDHAAGRGAIPSRLRRMPGGPRTAAARVQRWHVDRPRDHLAPSPRSTRAVRRTLVVVVAIAACSRETAIRPPDAVRQARIPNSPGRYAPSLVAIAGTRGSDTGTLLADVDSCASCHPDVAAQWTRARTRSRRSAIRSTGSTSSSCARRSASRRASTAPAVTICRCSSTG